MVSILKNNKRICTGSFIAEDLVLAAAKCFHSSKQTHKSSFEKFNIQSTGPNSLSVNGIYKIKSVDFDKGNGKHVSVITVSHTIKIKKIGNLKQYNFQNIYFSD